MTQLTKTDLQQLKQESTQAMPLALQIFQRDIKLPANIDKTKFMLSARTVFTKVRDIQKCEPGSIVGALVQTAVLGLDPNPDLGLVYFVPRNNRNTNQTELEFKLGYRGLKEIILRNKEITRIDTDIVCENDFFEVDKFSETPIKHRPNFMKDRGEPVAAYAVVKFRGEYIFEVLTKADIMDAKNRSDAKTSQYSPWNAQEKSVQLEMWKKTAFRRLCKLLPVSVQKGTEIDDAVIPQNAIKTTGEALEVDYTEVQTNVEYEQTPETLIEPPARTPEYQAKAEEAKQTVSDANEKTKSLKDADLERILSKELHWNGKIYQGGAFGNIYVKAATAQYDEKGIKVYLKSAEQAKRLEDFALQMEAKPKAQKPVAVVDDLPF